ncbi:hypothetical protein H0W80_01555 [Candidatus Saccharibacteria bacterium]|nr:hypothetical protein [Candidatus Saccharibacteria bacterium]
MDPQTPFDISAQPQKSKSSKQATKFYQIGLVALGVLTLVLFIFVLVLSSRASINDEKLNQATKEGQDAGVAAQKTADDKKAAELANSDLRTYTSPVNAGNFEISLPKSWSLAVIPNDKGSTISGLSSPDFIDTKLDQYPLRFALKNQAYTDVKKPYDVLAKGSAGNPAKMTSKEITVSGVKGTIYTGQADPKIPNGTVVLLPIRDKTYIIQTDDNAKYLTVFTSILSTLHLNP